MTRSGYRAFSLLLVWSLSISAAPAVEPVSGPLVIVTSFPEPLFKQFKIAFERQNPQVTVYIRSKKTSAAISFIEERSSEAADVFWASAPDAFEVLKESDSLMPLSRPPEAPRRIGDYPIDDPNGFYRGFAVSGYGLMWNRDYLARFGLPAPMNWGDLKLPVYRGHVGITAPSRSGTMHLIAEAILQGEGWEQGWATLSEIGGNLATITARSFGVPDGIKAGRFGVGPVIDFFGLSAKAQGEPVEFFYPRGTIFLPANVAVLKRAGNPVAAKAFVEFLLSTPGQRLLLEPDISRLPVDPQIYAEARAGYPNPFDGSLVAKGFPFDSQLSRQRYHLVNTLFDSLITYRIQSLRRAWQAIHRAEALLAGKPDEGLSAKIREARRLMSQVPASSAQASDPAVTGVFDRRKPGLPLSTEQVDAEAEWRRYFRRNHQRSMQLSAEVLGELEGIPSR